MGAPEDCADCANEVNEHLYRANLVQAEQNLDSVNYENIAFLADLEQGWNTPEKTRIAVRRCIEAGVNVIHIEDQGDKKRCGHLGDKELNSYDDYAVIMRSANLAIYRGTKVVEDGLASHVWMETPDADLQVAKDFLNGVNTNLSSLGKCARGLYNHSPSFDWDIKFVSEAKQLAEAVAEDIKALILNNNGFSFEA